MTRLVVVGASLAGLRAVQAARQHGFEGTITLVGAEEHLPYDRPPLSKAYLDAAAVPDVMLMPEQQLRDGLGVEVMLGAPATKLDLAAREVTVADRPVPYDVLVIATGARARTIPGATAIAGVHTLRCLEDAAAVRAALDAGARTVVVGAGFIGSEVASAARKRNLDVTVVEAADIPMMPAVGADVGSLLADLHRREGTDLRCGVTVKRIYRRKGRVRGVALSDGSVIDADLVVVGVGAAPATEWLAGSGLELDDGVLCDETLAARGADGVYAAGDIARWPNELFGTVMRVEHWTAAAEQGAAAAGNAVGPGPPTRYVTVPYFWSDWYRHRIQFVGVAGGDEVHLVTVDGRSESSRAEDQPAGRTVALYRRGDRVVGALTINGQAVVMKYRALIARQASWEEALAFRPVTRQAATVG